MKYLLRTPAVNAYRVTVENIDSLAAMINGKTTWNCDPPSEKSVQSRQPIKRAVRICYANEFQYAAIGDWIVQLGERGKKAPYAGTEFYQVFSHELFSALFMREGGNERDDALESLAVLCEHMSADLVARREREAETLIADIDGTLSKYEIKANVYAFNSVAWAMSDIATALNMNVRNYDMGRVSETGPAPRKGSALFISPDGKRTVEGKAQTAALAIVAALLRSFKDEA